MKKVISLALALIMALSMSAMAFAAEAVPMSTDAATTEATGTIIIVEANQCPKCLEKFANETEYNKHLPLCQSKVCPKCGEVYQNEDSFNKHLEICEVGVTKDYIDLTVKEILNMIIDIAKATIGQWDSIESVIVRLVDFIENIGTGVVGEADVNGAIAELEGLNIPGIGDLLDALKAKIKAMYAGEEATEAPTTAVEEPADTGSASVGIAVFAAVSVAAAAAYVCTKKN